MKKDKLQAFMDEYDDGDKNPHRYLLEMIRDHAGLAVDSYAAWTRDTVTMEERDRIDLNKRELFEKIARMVWIIFEYDLETSYTVVWSVKEENYAFSERDWKRGFKTLDEAKEFALAQSVKTSFEYVDEEGNKSDVAIKCRNFRIYKERNWVAAGEKRMLDKTLVSTLSKATGKFTNIELDEAA